MSSRSPDSGSYFPVLTAPRHTAPSPDVLCSMTLSARRRHIRKELQRLLLRWHLSDIQPRRSAACCAADGHRPEGPPLSNSWVAAGVAAPSLAYPTCCAVHAEQASNQNARGAFAHSEDDQGSAEICGNFGTAQNFESPLHYGPGVRTNIKSASASTEAATAAAALSAAMTVTMHTALETRRHRQRRQLRTVRDYCELTELQPSGAAHYRSNHSLSAISGCLEVGLGESSTSIDVALSTSATCLQNVAVNHDAVHYNCSAQSLTFELHLTELSVAGRQSSEKREAADMNGASRETAIAEWRQRQTAVQDRSQIASYQQSDVAQRLRTLEEPVDCQLHASADHAKSGAAALGKKKKRVSWQASHGEDKSGERASSSAGCRGDDNSDCRSSNGILNVAYDDHDDIVTTDKGIHANVHISDIHESSASVHQTAGANCDSPPEYYYAPDQCQLSRLLRTLRSRHGGFRSEELRFLSQIFANEKFARALSLLNSVERARATLAKLRWAPPAADLQLQGDSQRPTPVAVRLSALLCGRSSISAEGSVSGGRGHRSSRSSCGSEAAVELRMLLQQPHMQHLLTTYDILAKAQESPLPSSIAADDEELFNKTAKYAEKSIRIIHIVKGDGPLGATVKKEKEDVIIGRIVRGGEAARAGVLREGDELLEVNGLCMQGRTVDEVSNILATMCGQLTMVVSRADCPASPAEQHLVSSDGKEQVHSYGTKTVHFRALFDYAPDDDAFLPCKELGLAFHKGDILEIIDQSDPHWWQAYRVDRYTHARGFGGGIGSDSGRSSCSSWSTWSCLSEPLAGLIPSASFHHERESHRIWSTMQLASEEASVRKDKCRGCPFVSRKSSSRRKCSKVPQTSDVPEVLSYIEVAEYLPPTNRKRPVVLVGLPEAGRKQIRDLIMLKGGLGQFSVPVPHTTRPCKPTEIEGKDYHFIRRSAFEADVRAEKFVEHGQFDGHWYGTTVEDVRQIYHSGRTCLLILHPLSLQVLYKSGLMPFVVYVAMPQARGHLKMTLLQQADYIDISNEQLDGIVERTRHLEDTYGHLFDLTFFNGDHNRTADALLDAIDRLRTAPQWVPASWLEEAKAAALSHEQRLHASVDLRGAIWA